MPPETDYESSEDDNVIVQGVTGTPGAMGYFGYSYYEQNSDSLKAVAVDSGSGCVAPSAETAQDGTYTPLARPLFIYVNNESYSDKAQVASLRRLLHRQPGRDHRGGPVHPPERRAATETQSALDGLKG